MGEKIKQCTTKKRKKWNKIYIYWEICFGFCGNRKPVWAYITINLFTGFVLNGRALAWIINQAVSLACEQDMLEIRERLSSCKKTRDKHKSVFRVIKEKMRRTLLFKTLFTCDHCQSDHIWKKKQKKTKKNTTQHNKKGVYSRLAEFLIIDTNFR